VDFRALRRQGARERHAHRPHSRGSRSRHERPRHQRANVDELLSVDVEGWQAEVPLIKDHFAKFGGHLPKGLQDEVAGLEQRLKSARG
jgi:hypothetical protein